MTVTTLIRIQQSRLGRVSGCVMQIAEPRADEGWTQETRPTELQGLVFCLLTLYDALPRLSLLEVKYLPYSVSNRCFSGS